jgi:hypothetical protein
MAALSMRHHRQRRGTTYILVMGAAAMIGVIGLSGMLAARIQQRGVALGNDWNEAAFLAQSGIELGIARINADPNWRTNYVSGVESAAIPLGSGSASFKLVDAALGLPGGDGSLNNNSFDPVRLYGYGRVGDAVRVFSVQLIGATPLDALRTCMTAKGAGNNKEAIFASGPISTNGQFKIEEVVTANVEAGSINYGGAGAVDGTIVAPAAAKTLPDPTLFDAYKRLATTIPYGSDPWKPTAPLLSAAVNPLSGTTNSSGIYYIAIPAGCKIQLRIDHIKGTLLIDCADKAKFQLNDPIYWEPHSTDLPILLIRHQTNSGTDDELRPSSGFVTEGGQTYQSELHGLVYITGPSGASISAKLGGGGTASGTIITHNDFKVEGPPGFTCNWLSNLYLNPPVGFATGHKMKIASGSLLWEAGP